MSVHVKSDEATKSYVAANYQPLDADLTAYAANGPSAQFRNLLINPDGRFNQRAPATNADDTYGHDRWYALTQTNTIAVSTVSNAETGTPKMWRLTQSQASAQRMGYAQIIESANCIHLRGKTVTLSGRINFSLNAAVHYAILEWTGTADAVTSDVVGTWTSTTYTINNFFANTTYTISGHTTVTPAAATLTDLTALTVTLGSSVTNLIVFIWTDGTAAQNATLDGALQLEIGSIATVREIRPTQIELGLCERYCEKSYDIDTAPAAATVTGALLAVCYATTSIAGPFTFRTRKRTSAPTITLYSANGTSGKWTAAGNVDTAAASVNTASATGILAVSSSGLTAGAGYYGHWLVDNEL